MCPRQRAAEQCITQKFHTTRVAILGGQPLTGKSTLAKRITTNSSRKLVCSTYVPGNFTRVYSDVRFAFAAAIGMPLDTHCTSLKNIELSLRGIIGCREFRVIFDDARIHFGGELKQRRESLRLMEWLILHFPEIQVLLIGESDCLSEDLKALFDSEVPYTAIESWSLCPEYCAFVARIGSVLGLKNLQLSGESFVNALFRKTQGATGAVISILQTLARHPRYKDCSELPAESLNNLWRF